MSAPVDTIRMGRIKATIWQNDHDNKTYYNTTITRSFKVGDEWKENSSFPTEDLPLVRLVSDKAFERIHELFAENLEATKSHTERLKDKGGHGLGSNR